MTPLALASSTRLPTLPFPTPSLDGVNLDPRALKPRSRGLTAERAIIELRSRHTPENCEFYRRYYLVAARRGEKDGYFVKYAWNMNNPRSDRIIGHVIGDDLPAIRLLIGNAAANGLMTGIRWELCEDRDGESPIAVGRFDAWSLLQGITAADLERLAQNGQAPLLDRWDFDMMYLGKDCPGCGSPVSINMLAFNIDSAKCAKCGIRPHLSPLIGNRLSQAAASVTGVGEALITPTDAVLQTVDYLGFLEASMGDIAHDLPNKMTPHEMLKALLALSEICPQLSESGTAPRGLELKIRQLGLDGANSLTAHSAATMIKDAVHTGGPFDEITSKSADLLSAILRKKRASP
jgi:hypothetical protein